MHASMSVMAADHRMLPVGGYFNQPFNQPFYEGKMQMKARMDELKFFDVQLLKDDLCGTGSYGRVCKAMVDQLVCAAKIIHPTFFSDIDPFSTKTIHLFEKECDFLSAIRHPCIVQYLGTTQDKETGLPVLLMELMDESLTKFLERTQKLGEVVPYHNQVNLCHDVCMALAFLHSNGIVHRDLSGNNILLIAGSKAKVTDFGMSRLIDGNPRMTPLTQCPGCLVYMSPEALRTPPTYTEKLDIFSMGVCIIQTITCKFPHPSDAKRTVDDPNHGTIEVPIPERERRRDDIASIEPDNPLLGTALDCLADSEGNRPTSIDLCHRMLYYKTCEKYAESIEDAEMKVTFVKSLEENIGEKDRQIADLGLEVEAQAAKLSSLYEHHALECGAIREENHAEVQSLKAELEQLRRDYIRSPLSVNSNITDRSRSPSTLSSEGDFERVFVDMTDFQSILKIEEQLCLETPPPSSWYHGPLNRMSACQRLEAANFVGAYLIRESSSERGALVLSFIDREKHVHHFRIIRNSQRQYNIGGTIWFSSLVKLVGFHTKYSSVVEKHSERLDHPVAPPTPVPLPSYVL